MSLEAANYFWQWVATNPTLADFVKEGDDHLRLIKRGVMNGFPNIKGPVTVDHATLNNIPTNLAQKITAIAADSAPKGMIIMWDIESVPQLPAGWALCNGQTVEGYGTVPDLRNQFIKGWDGANNAGTIGGTATPTTGGGGAHTHAATGGAATLTVAQLPTITFRTRGSYSAGGYDGGSNQFFRILPGSEFTSSDVVEAVGGNQPHSHPDGTTDNPGDHTHPITIDPPHYRMVFLVKTTSLVLP